MRVFSFNQTTSMTEDGLSYMAQSSDRLRFQRRRLRPEPGYGEVYALVMVGGDAVGQGCLRQKPQRVQSVYRR
jgi:hypothetical protein